MTGEDQQVLQELLAAQNRREPVALAVIIRDQGSVPRHAGTKMLLSLIHISEPTRPY